MTRLRQPQVLPAGPASARWWVCLLTAMLFAFQVNYVRIHLLTEAHHKGVAAAPDHAHEHHGHDGHRHDSRQPHAVGNHELHLAGKRQISFLATDAIQPDMRITLPLPKTQVIGFVPEAGSRPGESPPDPRQPRAPPAV